jgi:hypothetical protein
LIYKYDLRDVALFIEIIDILEFKSGSASVIESTCIIEQLFSCQERTYSNIKKKEEKKSIPLLTGHEGRCHSRSVGPPIKKVVEV